MLRHLANKMRNILPLPTQDRAKSQGLREDRFNTEKGGGKGCLCILIRRGANIILNVNDNIRKT